MSKETQSHPPRQISLGSLLVVMLIFTVMSAGLFYASRIEEIQDELSLYFGIAPFGKGRASRRSHLMFLLFTYASPLMMAMVLSMVVGLMNRRR
ncbi:MAG: hypothetical protein ACO1RT_18120 [Planctomycetaceae bacterium]